MAKVRQSAPALRGMEPYDPKYLPADVFMSANENPDGLPGSIYDAIVERLATVQLNRYPDPLANDLRDMIAQAYDLERDNVLVGNGGDELLFDLALAWGGPGRTMLNLPPTFSVYAANAALTGTTVVDIPRNSSDFSLDEPAILERLGRGDVDFVIITSPNNPTGTLADIDAVVRILEATDALVLVDEAYGEFSGTDLRPLMDSHDNLLILHTFSKAYSLAGIRLGYILGHPDVIDEFKKVRQPYSVDAVSQIIGEEVFRRRDLFVPRTEALIEGRGILLERLAGLKGVEVFPSDANYILFRVPRTAEVWQRLYDEHSVLIRDVSGDPLLADCLRVTVGSPQENETFLTALGDVLAEGGR